MKLKVFIFSMFFLLTAGVSGGCTPSGAGTSSSDSSYAHLEVEYTENEDGTYTCNGSIFNYKIEVTGMEGESEVTFEILTNDKETRFEDVSHSLKKATMDTDTPEFVILGWRY